MPTTAPFVMEQAKRSGMPTSEAMEAMLRIEPHHLMFHAEE